MADQPGTVHTIADVMTPNVTTISPDATVGEAIHIFGERHFRHLVVADASGRLLGVLSDRDALRYLASGRDPSAETVAAIMHAEPVTVAQATPLADAIDLLSFHRIHCLPVVDAARQLRGIVTTTDLLATLYEILGRRLRVAARRHE